MLIQRYTHKHTTTAHTHTHTHTHTQSTQIPTEFYQACLGNHTRTHTHRSGALSLHEFEGALAKAGLHPTNPQMAALLAKYGHADEDGEVNIRFAQFRDLVEGKGSSADDPDAPSETKSLDPKAETLQLLMTQVRARVCVNVRACVLIVDG